MPFTKPLQGPCPMAGTAGTCPSLLGLRPQSCYHTASCPEPLCRPLSPLSFRGSVLLLKGHLLGTPPAVAVPCPGGCVPLPRAAAPRDFRLLKAGPCPSGPHRHPHPYHLATSWHVAGAQYMDTQALALALGPETRCGDESAQPLC